MLAAIAAATSSAAGLMPAAGATARTSAPTMAMMAMLEMTEPTITVKATTASTNRNWLECEITADKRCRIQGQRAPFHAFHGFVPCHGEFSILPVDGD